jgi:hypothetical protein
MIHGKINGYSARVQPAAGAPQQEEDPRRAGQAEVLVVMIRFEKPRGSGKITGQNPSPVECHRVFLLP